MSIKQMGICLLACLVAMCGCIGYLVYDINCTHGVYEINISAVCLSNNSVGNEWIKNYEMDGNIITSGKRITVPLDGTNEKTVNVIIIERDKHSDRSEKSINIVIENKELVTSTLTVVENNGRFKGNRAVWQIDISVDLIKRIICK